MRVLAIDPGPEYSAHVVWDGIHIGWKGIEKNTEIIFPQVDYPLIIEQVRSYGMAVGQSVFDTCFWAGRFCERWKGPFYQVPRREVKMYFCNSMRAKDSNIRQVLIDRFGEPGTIKQPGVLYGIKKDLWSAFALAVYWVDNNGGK